MTHPEAMDEGDETGTEPIGRSGADRGVEWSVCNQVPHLGNGDKAALRRMYLTNSYRADGVVQALLSRAQSDAASSHGAMFESWRLLAHAAAMISGTTGRFPHTDKRSLGRSLHLVGLKKNAINRLLTARGSGLADQVRRLIRVLARGDGTSIPTNLATLRDLGDPDPQTAEAARRLIARDFYAASDADDRKKKGDTK